MNNFKFKRNNKNDGKVKNRKEVKEQMLAQLGENKKKGIKEKINIYM